MAEKDSTKSVECRPIPGFPGYSVDTNGEVWSYYKRWKGGPRRLIQDVTRKGYLMVEVRRNRERYKRTVHRLVLEAFAGTRPQGLQCRHIDGNKKNNILANLAWGTWFDNHGDDVKNATGRAKLIEKDVLAIRRLASHGMSQTAIGHMFGVHKSTVCQIVHRLRWKHI